MRSIEQLPETAIKRSKTFVCPRREDLLKIQQLNEGGVEREREREREREKGERIDTRTHTQTSNATSHRIVVVDLNHVE